MRRTAIMMIVVGALIFALTAATAMAAPGKGGGKAPGKAKIALCHKGKTINVAAASAKGHKKHGDTVGACATPPATAPPEATTPATTMETTAAPAA